MSDDDKDKYHHCSFCGRHQDYVEVLVAGVSAMICEECIRFCAEIVADKRRSKIEVVDKEATK